MPDLAYCNGEFRPLEEARISVDDRGFVFGDGIYEVIAAYDGVPFLLDAHFQRMRHSLAGIELELDPDAAGLAGIVVEGLRRCAYRDALVYIQITRGVAPRAHLPTEGLEPTVVVTFRPLPEPRADLRDQGVAVITTPDTRWARCSVKATTLLPNVLAGMEARRRGCHDAVFVSPQGHVRESTHANIVAVRGGGLCFPPRDASILHGITLAFLERCAAASATPIVEAPLSVSDLRTADEAFLSNTVFEILPVIRVDDQVIGDGTPGPITRTMLGAFQTQRRAWIADASNRPLGASPTGASIGADAARCCSDEG